MQIIRSQERGHTKLDWLDSRHTFSFGEYHDPKHVHFHTLRVINQDIVQPNTGFGTHAHDNMEIITYVIKGEVTHRDSMGSEGIIHAGEIQVMSAGTGVTHSEYNYSQNEILELIQIWIFPKIKNLKPSYQQMAFTPSQKTLLVAPTHENHNLIIHQDAKIYSLALNASEKISHQISKGINVWLQIISGEIKIASETFYPGDGIGIENQDEVIIEAISDFHGLMFEVE